MGEAAMKLVACMMCGYKFSSITNTHLESQHGITMRVYMRRFPKARIQSRELALAKADATRGKSYEEIHGNTKGAALRLARSHDASLQMEDDWQRDRRRITAKYVRTDATKQKLSESKMEHGGSSYRTRALYFYGAKCQRCGLVPKKKSYLHVHHIDETNINTELADHSLENLMVLCVRCHRRLHNEISKCSRRFYGIRSIEKGVHFLLRGMKEAFNLDLNNPNFKETPQRIARAYAEIFEGVADTDAQVQEILDSGFLCRTSQMVIEKNIRAFSMCPHHLLPVEYKVVVAYLPAAKREGSVLGLSKLVRLIQILARRPVLQEQFTSDVTEALMRLKGCFGAGCLVQGRHFCMVMRGVNQPDVISETSSLAGRFMNSPTLRAEFLALAQGRPIPQWGA
jgi:GTP cyclohydrolase I